MYDWFDHPQVMPIDEHRYDVRIHANEQSVLWWILQYADTGCIDVLAPQSLRDSFAAVGADLVNRYASTGDHADPIAS